MMRLLDPACIRINLLFRLFHEDGVRVFDPYRWKCAAGAPPTRVETMLKSFPRDEIATLKSTTMWS